MKFPRQLAKFLFRKAFWIYRPLYFFYKSRADAFEISLIRKHVRKGDVILDIGANIGFFAKYFSALTGPSGKVHCFEPEKLNFQRLSEAMVKFHNVTIHQKAVSNVSGKLKLYISAALNVDHRSYEPDQYESITRSEEHTSELQSRFGISYA